jgi:hypothetical protein
VRLYRPGILASRAKRVADAHLRSLPLLRVIEAMQDATISEMVAKLNEEGFRAARGGRVTYNTVQRALLRLGKEVPSAPRHGHSKTGAKRSLRSRAERYEVFRTPSYSYEPLLSYRPEWFQGRGFDPCAGDGRMIREIINRGNPGPHFVNDIRKEELPFLLACGQATVGDYLAMIDPPECEFLITNPPFTKAVEIVERARTHISGPICVLQSIGWQSTHKRSEWLRKAGLAYVLNLPRRPKWEVDSGEKVANNIWDFAWFIFLPDYVSGTTMDWLVEAV